ncbi:hypothetical protein X474_07945 [Dethiosulfatarculus sandiegensis]|uniref:Uncharacterized protein n=1 Tax=Dethiosulfatarculus sandiegensis TaxID=1429043 RepID=A0A0D2JG02_9BACT|nr:hypothetical protein X474_07945 [Dethiosulfatarculus sandiegensis]
MPSHRRGFCFGPWEVTNNQAENENRLKGLKEQKN